MYQRVKDFFSSKPEEAAVAWHQQNILTPDIWKLEQQQFQLIFVPDDMMRGRINNNLIAEAGYAGDTPVHPACFTLERFTFWKKDLGINSIAIAMEKEYKPSNFVRTPPIPAKIKGELYAILSPRIKKLDIHRQNGIQFKRIRTSITLPYRQVEYSSKHPIPNISIEYIHTVEASMYVGVPEYWDDRIGGIFDIKECNQFELDEPKFWLERFYKFD